MNIRGCNNYPPYIRDAANSLMEFLFPIFKNMEEIYKLYAPTMYARALQRIEYLRSRNI
jgi:hypothetical protein